MFETTNQTILAIEWHINYWKKNNSQDILVMFLSAH